jgi:hypothetical protein
VWFRLLSCNGSRGYGGREGSRLATLAKRTSLAGVDWLGRKFINFNVSFLQHSFQNMPASPVEKIGDRRKRIMKATIQMYIILFQLLSSRHIASGHIN